MKLHFPEMIVENYSNIEFHKNPYKTDGQADTWRSQLSVFTIFRKYLQMNVLIFTAKPWMIFKRLTEVTNVRCDKMQSSLPSGLTVHIATVLSVFVMRINGIWEHRFNNIEWKLLKKEMSLYRSSEWFRALSYSYFFVSLRRNNPQWAMASSFMRFLDHTKRHTTVGRTPLDERSARRRNLYLITHN